MPRVPVPDDYRGSSILVAGTEDYHYPDADVQVDAPTARTLQIREDDDGRYCGPPEQFADAVADYLGVESPVSDDADGEEGSDSDTADDEPGDSDANPEGSGGETPDADGEYPPAEKTVGAHWNQIVAAVNDGVYDDALETVAENDDRDSVQNAIEDRRAALEDADG